MPSVTVLRFEDRLAVWPERALPSGHHARGVHAVILDAAAPDAELGLAVTHALAVAAIPSAEQGAADAAPLARALGAVVFGAIEIDGRCVLVAPRGDGCEVTPTRGLGLGAGFEPSGPAVVLATLEAAAVGAAVRQAMEQAQAAPDDGAKPAAPAAEADEDDLIADLRKSAAWVAEGLERAGYRVDGTVASLAELDRFFDEHTRKPGKPKRRGLLAEDVGAKLFGIGGYVGEVLAREGGWAWQPGGSEVDVAMRSPAGETVWPVQRVMKRFELGPEESLGAYGRALLQKP